jgi:large subunit ribosomal protein L20
MPRAKSGAIHRGKRKRILKDVKGFIGSRKNIYRTAKDARRRKLTNSYIDRRRKKRDFRILWIIRINAAARLCGTSYGRLIFGLKNSGIDINRKMLADMAVNDLNSFKKIVETVNQVSA